MKDLTPFIELSNPIISSGKTGGYRFSVEINEKKKSIRRSIIEYSKSIGVEAVEFRGKVVFRKIENLSTLLTNVDVSKLQNTPKWNYFIELIMKRASKLKYNLKASYCDEEKNIYINYINSK